MKQFKSVKLKPGKDAPVRAGHPWVFSGALAGHDSISPGEVCNINDSAGTALGSASWHGSSSVRLRRYSELSNQLLDREFFRNRFSLLQRRKMTWLPERTSGYRLVHADADWCPGLVIDVYDNVVVVQITTAAMERARPAIIAALQELYPESCLVERSDLDPRKADALQPKQPEVIAGKLPAQTIFMENGLRIPCDPLRGQKTGFFLDQRDTRLLVFRLAKGKKVLNLFSYSGAFGLHAFAGGATEVWDVDSSTPALELSEEAWRLNQFPASAHRTSGEDVFDFLARKVLPEFDLIVCDPPALAKHKNHRDSALKAYLHLNRACFSLLKPGGILVSGSCTGVVSDEDFTETIRHAAGQAGRQARFHAKTGLPSDHTQLVAFPEGRYLKNLVHEIV